MCGNYLIRFHHESNLPVTYILWAHVIMSVLYTQLTQFVRDWKRQTVAMLYYVSSIFILCVHMDLAYHSRRLELSAV